MTVIVNQVVHARRGYSLLDTKYYGFLSERGLTNCSSKLKLAKKSPRLPGKRRAKETRYFYRNARALALYAKDKSVKLKDTIIAVLFHDSDERVSAGRTLWDDKWRSMIDGFSEENFTTGVPMIPKPTSEAWLICALKENSYQGCAALENRSGSRRSPNPLKGELRDLLGHQPSREELCGMVNDRIVDVDRIDMPSFDAFKTRLEQVI